MTATIDGAPFFAAHSAAQFVRSATGGWDVIIAGATGGCDVRIWMWASPHDRYVLPGIYASRPSKPSGRTSIGNLFSDTGDQWTSAFSGSSTVVLTRITDTTVEGRFEFMMIPTPSSATLPAVVNPPGLQKRVTGEFESPIGGLPPCSVMLVP
jgi:hypothetical protein